MVRLAMSVAAVAALRERRRQRLFALGVEEMGHDFSRQIRQARMELLVDDYLTGRIDRPEYDRREAALWPELFSGPGVPS